MNDNDTIFALSSAAGKAGVSVIRISGKLAEDSLKLFSLTEPEGGLDVLRTVFVKGVEEGDAA